MPRPATILWAQPKVLAEREKGIYADLVKIASEVGCNFTAQDARKAHVKTVRELSKEKLDQVTGGEFINSGAWTGPDSSPDTRSPQCKTGKHVSRMVSTEVANPPWASDRN